MLLNAVSMNYLSDAKMMWPVQFWVKLSIGPYTKNPDGVVKYWTPGMPNSYNQNSFQKEKWS